MAEILAGVIERVTFHNPENGFAVLRVQAEGRPELVTLVGQMPSALAGEYIEATGAWINDREHGLQFKADEIKTTPPHTAKGIERYLASGLIKGVGPHYPRKIVAVVRANPYRLATDIWGIGFQTADELAGRLGIDRSSPLRAQAALRYVLQQLSNDGHVGFPETSVVQRTAELTQIDAAIVHDAVEHERAEDQLVRDTIDEEPWLYLKPLYL